MRLENKLDSTYVSIKKAREYKREFNPIFEYLGNSYKAVSAVCINPCASPCGPPVPPSCQPC